MTRFHFEIADAAHDAALRRRMAEDWMDGRVAVSFRREPSFFAGRRLQGDAAQTLVCTDKETGNVVALGTRTSARAHVNGRPVRIGYLADLRFHPRYRRGTLLARGYRHLQAMHAADPLPFYTSVIYEGNETALRVLGSGRAGLPTYREFGRLLTPALRLDRDLPPIVLPDISLEPGNEADLPSILGFLNGWMVSRQFGPCVDADDLRAGRMSGLRAQDFIVARRSGEIVGTLALWDQTSMRQTHVEHYRGVLGLVRPIVNVIAAARGVHPLPRPGARLPSIYLAWFAVAQDDERVAACLLRDGLRRARRGGWHFAVCGLHERDPLVQAVKPYPAVPAAGRLFVVHYAQDEDQVSRLDGRVPRLEAGCL